MNGQSAPWWNFYYGEDEIFFGHEVTPEATQVSEKVFAMDGGACFGMELRACVVDPDGTKHFYTQKCETAYATYSKDWNEEKTEDSVQVGIDQAAQGRLVSLGSFIEPVNEEIKKREALVAEGFLNRKVYKDLFLYNYTPKCTYDKHWNETTRASRGIIFDSVTGELVSWTPDKFFNVNEMPETILENLPVCDFEVFEKVDGSFVSVSHWDTGNEWIFATRGSFESEQATQAKLIFLYKDGDVDPAACEVLNKNYSYVFEVLYPENRHNDGARLVVDYGDVRTLVGLAIFNKDTKKELSTWRSIVEFDRIGFKMAQKYVGVDLDKLIELQKTLPSQKEGFVVKFVNGLRVKFKTEEYVRMNRILNSMNIKTVWESMVDGKVPVEYMRLVPEEIREEAEKYKAQLENEHLTVLSEFVKEANIWVPVIPRDDKDSEAFKTIGLFMKDNASKFKYPMLVFPWVRNKPSDIARIIKDIIRPKLGD
jgi:RNA ligase